jgi:Fe-S-cluster containining protein
MATPTDPLIEKLRTLYLETDALFAGWSCAASGECCRFSVTGRQPLLWPIEWRYLGQALRANPARKGTPVGDCPAYDSHTQRCRAYSSRPFGCRTHFCSQACAGGKNPRAEIRQLARRLADLSAADEASGSLRPLLSWQSVRVA